MTLRSHRTPPLRRSLLAASAVAVPLIVAAPCSELAAQTKPLETQPSTQAAPAVKAFALDTAPGPVRAPSQTLTSWREAVALASAQDPDYSVAVIEVERLRGVHRQVLAGALPTLTGSANITFNLLQDDITTLDPSGDIVTRTIPASPQASFSLSVRQPLIAARTWWAIGTASENIELAELNLEDKKRLLVAGVANAIVTVVTAERVAEINRVGANAALERLRLQRRRRELGSGSDLDVLRFQQDVVAAQSQLISGDESLEQARERLGLALGTTERYGVDPNISINEIEDTLGRICETGELNDRADLRALRKQKDITERAVTDADLLYVPTADFVSTFTYSSEQIIGNNHESWSIQGVLTVPIWDGGARYGIRRSAVASVQIQEERLEAAERVARIEVNQSARGVIVAEQARDVARQGRDIASEVNRLAQAAFEQGDGTSFDVVDASRRLREAELNLAIRELELVRARITALLATSTCKV